MQTIDLDRRALRIGSVRTVTFQTTSGTTTIRATVLDRTTRTVFLGDETTFYAEIPLDSVVSVTPRG